MEILRIRHAYPEAPPFTINRPYGLDSYTFLHFFGPVEILVNGKKLTTKPGACLFYAPDTPQWFFSSSPVIHDWAHFDRSLKPLLVKYGISENTVYYPKNTRFITELFREMESEFFSNNPFSDELIHIKAETFLIFFARTLKNADSSTAGAEEELFCSIRQKILFNLSHPWTVSEMASLAGLSSSRFHVVYKKIFGISPLNDVIEARMTLAKNRLVSDYVPIYELADSLGYSNEYHFIRQFKKHVGCSPTEYRKRGNNTY